MSLTRQVLIALVAGLTVGLLLQGSVNTPPVAAVLQAADVVGTLWVNAIRMTVIPLVVSLLITGVNTAADPSTVRRVGGRAFGTFIGLLGLSAILGLLYVPLLYGFLEIDPATSAALRESAAKGAQEVGEAARAIPSFAQFLTNLVPTNPVKAAADGAMLPLVVFSLAFGLALTRVNEELRAPVLKFFQAVAATTLVVVRWIIAIAAVGVFTLMMPMAARTGWQTAGALTYYMAAISLACFTLLLLLYPTVALVARVGIRRFAHGVFPAQAVAVSTSSSLASLPALIDGAEQRLKLPNAVTTVVLPLAVSTFKVSAPVMWTAAVLFLARLYGIELAVTDRLTILFTAALSSFSVPGVPHGWLLLISPLLASTGIPVEAVALLFAVDVVPDIFATTLNVTADMAAATIVASRHPADAG